MDDLKISHAQEDMIKRILADLNKEFGKITPLTETTGKIHDYVGITIEYTKKGKVKFSMFDYLEEIIDNVPEESKVEATSPAGSHLFTVDKDAEKLNEDDSNTFHNHVAKLLFMAKRTLPDIATAIALSGSSPR